MQERAPPGRGGAGVGGWFRLGVPGLDPGREGLGDQTWEGAVGRAPSIPLTVLHRTPRPQATPTLGAGRARRTPRIRRCFPVPATPSRCGEVPRLCLLRPNPLSLNNIGGSSKRGVGESPVSIYPLFTKPRASGTGWARGRVILIPNSPSGITREGLGRRNPVVSITARPPLQPQAAEVLWGRVPASGPPSFPSSMIQAARLHTPGREAPSSGRPQERRGGGVAPQLAPHTLEPLPP